MGLPSLVLGDFDLTDPFGSNFGVSVIAEGTSRGAPVPIEVAVKSWLQDGSIVVTQGYDNRTVTLRVRLRGPDLIGVADCEAALNRELGKPNTLTWTPGDGMAPASVFVVVTSSMEHSPGADEDLAEALAYPWRTYNLRLLCEAFVRSEDEVVTPALPASGTTTTLVDDGSSTTGWTGAVNGSAVSPAVSSGAVGVTSGSIAGDTVLTLTRTGAIATSSTPFVTVDWQPTQSGYVLHQYPRDLVAHGDGIPLALVTATLIPGGIRNTYLVPAASISTLRLDLTVKQATDSGASGQPAVRTFFVDNVSRTDVRPSIGTTRQQLRTIAQVGSAPTPGALTVSHPTNPLGDALVYVWNDADDPSSIYVPALSPFFTTPSPTPDATLVSGYRWTVPNGGGVGGGMPARGIPPGIYTVMMRAAAASGSFSGAVNYTVYNKVGSTNWGIYTSPTIPVAFTSAYTIYPIGRVVLPTTDVRDPSVALMGFTLGNYSGTGNSINVDDIWLFNGSIGTLNWVDCGTGTAASGGPSRLLVIDPPTVSRPRPQILRGHATDGSDAFFAGVNSWQPPKFKPPVSRVFTVTTNALDASASFRSFPRWHTHAAS